MSNYLGKNQPHQNDAVFIHAPHLAISLLSASRKAPIATESERGRETYPASRSR